jgi:hypothetical protein
VSLTFDLKSARDLFAKLRRDAEALDQQVTSDRLFNFVVTGYSMIDWIRNDPNVPARAKAAAVVDGLRRDRWLKICGDLANACKHFTLQRRSPVAVSAQSEGGYGAGRYGHGGYGVGEESIDIELDDGTSLPCLELVKNILETWRHFIEAHGI